MFATLSGGQTEIVVAVVGCFTALMAVTIPILFTLRRATNVAGVNSDKLTALDQELRTNNGRTASQYLEMIADLRNDQAMVTARIDGVLAKIEDHDSWSRTQSVRAVQERQHAVDSVDRMREKVHELGERIHALEAMNARDVIEGIRHDEALQSGRRATG